ncbi:6656_t:CDS:2 [Dentiscutata heterogama]|uniref:6656_t:CDS:1 n=1 Tax=Dentiscutata heterogama TaxID=1316150 RepID=A0ACA9LJ50_9GLOM|nr:6656_t:CDS:2 [Dentiscutata heterogama]
MDTALLTGLRDLTINPAYTVLCTSDNKSIQSRHTFFPSLPTPPNEYAMDEDQDFITDGDSSCEAFAYNHDNSIEGEDDYDEADESYISSNFDTTINDPEFANFSNELSQESGNVTSFQKIYYFNTCSYEVPHYGNHMQPALRNIALIVESWLTEKLLYRYAGDAIPILEESPQISAESVMTKLKMALGAFNNLSKVYIKIRAGHVYSLHMINDEIVISPNHKQFIQEFPLFVNVSIKVQKRSAAARNTMCRVLVGVEHVTMQGQSMAGEIKAPISHHQLTNGNTTIRRTVSSADGQAFYLLDEAPTTLYFMGNDNARFYSGASYAGEIIVRP